MSTRAGAPEGGRLITATRDSDREWLGRNVKPGQAVRFDMRTGLTPIVQAPSERVSCFVNPLHGDVRRHELDVVRELVTLVQGSLLLRSGSAPMATAFCETRLSCEAGWGATYGELPRACDPRVLVDRAWSATG